MLEIVAHVVAAERLHRERITPQIADRADIGCRGFRGSCRTQKYTVIKTVGFIDQGHDTRASSAENKNINGHAFGLFPIRADDRTLRGRRGETGVGVCRHFFLFSRPVLAFPVNGMLGRRAVHAFPPDVAVIGQGAIGEDDIFLDGLHRHGIGTVRGARRHAEKSGFRIDGVEPSVGADFHPGDIVADAFTFPAFDGRLEHRQIGLAAGGGKGGGDMILLAFGIRQSQNQHVLGHPAFAFGHGRRDAQRQTFLAQERVAAVAGTVRPDQVLIRKMADVFFLNRRAGPGNILLPFFQRSADGMHTGNEIALIAEFLENFLAHTGHDVHVADHIGTVGNLDADFGNRRINRAHGKRNDVHRAPLHASLVEALHGFLQFSRFNPVVRGTGIHLIGSADIGAVLHTRDI